MLIGDLSGTVDKHYTLAGMISGSLILINVFVGLEQGIHKITVGWIFTLLIGYVLVSSSIWLDHSLSFRLFYKRLGEWLNNRLGKYTKKKGFQLLKKTISSIGILIPSPKYLILVLLTYLSFWFFNKPVNVLVLIFVLLITERSINRWEIYQRKKQEIA